MRLPLCLVTLFAASCVAVPSASNKPSFLSQDATPEAEATKPQRKKRIRLEFFTQQDEFEEFKLDTSGGATTDVFDGDRTRTGLRATFGTSMVRGYAQIFHEDWDIDPLTAGMDFDIFGFGGGVTGSPTVHRFTDDMRLILPYRFGLNLGIGTNEFSGATETDIAYFEFEGELGIGADLYGAQPSVGIYGSAMDASLSPDVGSNSDVTGTNTGVFFQLLYKSDNFPVHGGFRLTGGDVTGGTVSLGFGF